MRYTLKGATPAQSQFVETVYISRQGVRYNINDLSRAGYAVTKYTDCYYELEKDHNKIIATCGIIPAEPDSVTGSKA